jgi:hypothetical protein
MGDLSKSTAGNELYWVWGDLLGLEKTNEWINCGEDEKLGGTWCRFGLKSPVLCAKGEITSGTETEPTLPN